MFKLEQEKMALYLAWEFKAADNDHDHHYHHCGNEDYDEVNSDSLSPNAGDCSRSLGRIECDGQEHTPSSTTGEATAAAAEDTAAATHTHTPHPYTRQTTHPHPLSIIEDHPDNNSHCSVPGNPPKLHPLSNDLTVIMSGYPGQQILCSTIFIAVKSLMFTNPSCYLHDKPIVSIDYYVIYCSPRAIDHLQTFEHILLLHILLQK